MVELLDSHEANFLELGNVHTVINSNLSKITQRRRFLIILVFIPELLEQYGNCCREKRGTGTDAR